jgi:hypothetical protein
MASRVSTIVTDISVTRVGASKVLGLVCTLRAPLNLSTIP